MKGAQSLMILVYFDGNHFLKGESEWNISLHYIFSWIISTRDVKEKVSEIFIITKSDRKGVIVFSLGTEYQCQTYDSTSISEIQHAPEAIIKPIMIFIACASW